ncbi:MMRN1, partial [Cervus elaphus hippelaphus]
MNETFLQTQLEAWEIDRHGKRISAEVTALAAKEPASKSRVLKQPEENILKLDIKFSRELESCTSSTNVVAHHPVDGGRAAHSAIKLDHDHHASVHGKMRDSHIASQDWKKEQQQLIHSKQAESHAAVGRGALEQQQQQDCGDPAVMQKMTDQMNYQAMKLTLLQKKIDNISLAVSDVRSTYSSLEEKFNEDKGREFQSFLKGLKSKSINDLVKETVREQLKFFQNDIEETVAQLFKTVSTVSKELENVKQIIQQVNESVISVAVQQKSVLMQENRPTSTDILDLKNHIVNIRQEMTFKCEKPVKELEAKQTHLEDALEQEHSRRILYYESLNKTLSKMKEVQEHLLSTEQTSNRKSVPVPESVSNNITEYVSTLYQNIKKQGLMLLQISDDLHTQDSKINNLTLALEMEKESVREECEDMLSKYRDNFKVQIKDTEENLQVLNQTLVEFLFPMDNKMDKMNEQLNDLTYDMEILQPLLEQGASLRETMTYEQPKEVVATKKKVESLTSAVNSLNVLTKELTRRYNLLRNEVQSRGVALDRRINEHALEMEDGLNKTITIVNDAIDFIQDNYVLKETLNILKYNPEIHHKCTQNMDTILTFISQFQHLNDSIQILVNDDQRYNFVLQTLYEVVTICHDASRSISELNATIPKRIKDSLPNMQLLQKSLTEHVESVMEIKTQIALSNLTWYINQSLSSSIANIVKSQKQIKPSLKKLNALKPTVNLTTFQIGRAQRNTDNILLP